MKPFCWSRIVKSRNVENSGRRRPVDISRAALAAGSAAKKPWASAQRLIALFQIGVFLSIAANVGAEDGITSGRYHPSSYKAPRFDSAKLHEKVALLPEYRTRARIDVYVPKDVGEDERRPCVILFYGGGKVGGIQGAIYERRQADDVAATVTE